MFAMPALMYEHWGPAAGRVLVLKLLRSLSRVVLCGGRQLAFANGCAINAETLSRAPLLNSRVT